MFYETAEVDVYPTSDTRPDPTGHRPTQQPRSTFPIPRALIHRAVADPEVIVEALALRLSKHAQITLTA